MINGHVTDLLMDQEESLIIPEQKKVRGSWPIRQIWALYPQSATQSIPHQYINPTRMVCGYHHQQPVVSSTNTNGVLLPHAALLV